MSKSLWTAPCGAFNKPSAILLKDSWCHWDSGSGVADVHGHLETDFITPFIVVNNRQRHFMMCSMTSYKLIRLPHSIVQDIVRQHFFAWPCLRGHINCLIDFVLSLWGHICVKALPASLDRSPQQTLSNITVHFKQSTHVIHWRLLPH